MTIKKIAYYTITFFFWIVLVQQLMVIYHLPQLPLLSLFAIVNACLGTFCIFHIPKYQKIDLLVFLYLAYILFSIIIADYSNQWEYIYRALVTQVPYIFFYFIGRASGLSFKEVLKNMKWPILFCLVCGLYFFFNEPTWYSEMKQAQIKEYATELNIMEVYRLSGFWGHPYVLAYASFLYTLYLLDEYFTSSNLEEEDNYCYTDLDTDIYEENDTVEIVEITQQEKTNSNIMKKVFIVLQLILIGIVILLAQLRIVLLMFVCAIIYYIFKKSSMSMSAKITVFCSATILMFALLYFAQSILPDSNIEYITNHIGQLFEENSTTERLNYTSGGTKIEDPIFGNGFARYNIVAREHNIFALIDSEYQKHYYETGCIGVGFMFLLFASFAVYLLKQPKHEMEKMYLLFIMLASIGASVLSNSTQYAYIFWFAMGASYSQEEEIEESSYETEYHNML